MEGCDVKILLPILAALELVAWIVVLIFTGMATTEVNESSSSPATDVFDTKERVASFLRLAIGTGVFSLISIISVLEVKSIGDWLLQNNLYWTSFKGTPENPSGSMSGMCWKGLLVLTGDLGLVLSGVCASYLGATMWMIDYLVWKAKDDETSTEVKEGVVFEIQVALIIAIVAIVHKIIIKFMSGIWVVLTRGAANNSAPNNA